MFKVREILRMAFHSHLSQNQIAAALRCSKGVVNQTLKRFKESGVTWPLPDSLVDTEIHLLLYPKEKPYSHPRYLLPSSIPNLEEVEESLAEPGGSIQRLFEEYITLQPQGLKRSQYFQIVRTHLKTKQIHLRMDRKPGEKLFIDFAGTALRIHPSPSVTQKLPLFICSLGASGKCFAVPLKDQSTQSVLDALTLCLAFYGGCPWILVPDNMKSMVIKASYTNPILNELASRFCEHHGITLLPARPYKPRDKALVENSVRHLGNLILWRLRKVPLDSLERAQELCHQVVLEFNAKIMPLYKKSRDERFLELDKPCLQPLPNVPFEILRIDRNLRAGADYHVRLAGNFYSIPYSFANMHVDVLSKKKVAEFYIEGNRIASHVLREAHMGETVTSKNHLHPNHADFRFSGKEHRLEEAARIGPSTLAVAKKIFEHTPYLEVGLRRCRHLSVLAKSFGKDALEKICLLGLSAEIYLPEDLEAMLKLGLHLEKSQNADQSSRGLKTASPPHENLRGKTEFTITYKIKGDENDRANGT